MSRFVSAETSVLSEEEFDMLERARLRVHFLQRRLETARHWRLFVASWMCPAEQIDRVFAFVQAEIRRVSDDLCEAETKLEEILSAY